MDWADDSHSDCIAVLNAYKVPLIFITYMYIIASFPGFPLCVITA